MVSGGVWVWGFWGFGVAEWCVVWVVGGVLGGVLDFVVFGCFEFDVFDFVCCLVLWMLRLGGGLGGCGGRVCGFCFCFGGFGLILGGFVLCF